MKKIIFFLCVICSLKSFGQATNPQTIGSKATIVINKGALVSDSALILPAFPDTTAANRGPIPKYYPGNLIRVGNDVWMRSIVNSWIKVNSSGSGTVTSISQGYGITNIPNPIVATGTIKADTTSSGLSGYYLRRKDSVATGYATFYQNSLKQNLITLTTTGSSGPSTFNQGTGALNIPQYSTATPSLQQVTDVGDTTNHTISIYKRYDHNGIVEGINLENRYYQMATPVADNSSPAIKFKAGSQEDGTATIYNYMTHDGGGEGPTLNWKFHDNIFSSDTVLMGKMTYSGFHYYGNLGLLRNTFTGGQPTIAIQGATSGSMDIKASDTTGSWTLRLPPNNGDSLQFLQTDGNGTTKWATPAGGGSGAISALTAATATNAINNAAYEQEWRWNTLSSGSGLKLSSTSTALLGGNLFHVTQSGTNANSGSTSTSIYATNEHGGTGAINKAVHGYSNGGATNYGGYFEAISDPPATNIAGYFNANSGTNNYAIIVPTGGGSVGLGNSAPTEILDVTGNIRLSSSLLPDANDGAVLGSSSLQFSDLFLAEGGVINWDNGDATLTQVGNMVSLNGADFTATGSMISGIATWPSNVNSNIGTGNVNAAIDNNINPNAIYLAFGNNVIGAGFIGAKTRSTDGTGLTTIVSGDDLMGLRGWGTEGTTYKEAASIFLSTEGTIASTRIPGKIVFKTATNAAPSVLTERMSINSAGTVRMNAYGAGTATFDASGNISSVSDERLKNITGQYSGGLKELMNINPISFNWNTKSGYETKHSYIGFSAQNIMSSLGEGSYGINSEGYLSIQDRAIMATMINAIKEQQKQIEELKSQIKNK